MEVTTIVRELTAAAEELIGVAKPRRGQIFVVGCSTSEVLGNKIGTGGSSEVAVAMFKALKAVCDAHGLFLAVQCCEHLNRALVMEEATAEKFGYEIVNVRPWAHAGGSFATAVWENLEHPAAVEHIRAKAGMDIGATLIGMHLKEVAVPVRLSLNRIGEATLVCARTRPRFIGGERARYQEELK